MLSHLTLRAYKEYTTDWTPEPPNVVILQMTGVKNFTNKNVSVTSPLSCISPPKIVVTLHKPWAYTTTSCWLRGWSLFVLAGRFVSPERIIYWKNVNSRYIWRRVIPVPHSENLFFQYRFNYFIHFSCFNFSFFTGLYGKSSIMQIRNHLSSPMLKLWSLNCLITIKVFWFSGENYNFYIFCLEK